MHIGSWRKVAAVLVGALTLSGPIVGLAAVTQSTDVGALPAPTLSVTPTSLTFNNTLLGTYTEQKFTVSNNTGSEITLQYFARSGANGNDFTIVVDDNATCPDYDTTSGNINLQDGHSCTIGVRFFPSALGARSATLTLTTDAQGQDPVPGTSVNVAGNGTIGYYQVTSKGSIGYAGDAAFYGDLTNTPLNSPIVGMAAVGNNGGYWLAAADGGVFTFGPSATFHGSAGGLPLNKPIVGIAAPLAGSGRNGYWLVASDGGIFSYGLPFFGSTGAIHLNKPMVGMASTLDGGGYWLVASDGGIFAYGDAQFYGSTGSIHLNQPIVGMAPTPDSGGYWLVAADGGIFAYGDAQFYGSTGALHLVAPIISMAAMPDGGGYWFSANDGGIFNYGTAPFYGAGNADGLTDIVSMATNGEPTIQSLTGGVLPFLRTAHVVSGNGGFGDSNGQLEVQQR
ncbi:MAG TPA: choice-of-anchor D domain-containing protein [Acidimicrobiales bacterium]|nr:choice-of-anchor D domain-containing protein [Acidimicrobiales bacterium]